MSRYQQIGQTILQQLGGNRFVAMTGATSFSAGDFGDNKPGLSFKLPGGKGVIITLSNDLYDLKVIRSGYFRKDRWTDTKILGSAQHVDVESLRPTFTRLTGLHTSL